MIHFPARRAVIAVGATIAATTLALVPNVQALPGQWSIPVPVNTSPDPGDLPGSLFTGNGFEWALAPAGGTGSPLNLFALRLEVPGNLVDLGVLSVPFDYGAVGVEMPAGTGIADITRLSFDTFYETGVSCGGGSPRFQLAVDTNGDGTSNGNVFVYAGPYPNFNLCPDGAWAHEDLMAGTLNWDSTQLGGPFYGTQADAISAGGASIVLRATAVWDSWWQAPGRSVIWLDNLRVNDFLLDEPVKGHVCSLAAGVTGGPVCP